MHGARMFVLSEKSQFYRYKQYIIFKIMYNIVKEHMSIKIELSHTGGKKEEVGKPIQRMDITKVNYMECHIEMSNLQVNIL